MTTINENTLLPYTFAPKDADGVAISPSTVRWRLDCLTTGTAISDWASVSPAASIAITIPATSNVIVNNANPSETKRITVQFDAGLSTGIQAEEDYIVTNNRFVT